MLERGGRLLGNWKKLGSSTQVAYSEKPDNRAVRFVNSTGRRVSMRISTIGWATLVSATAHAMRNTAAATNRPRTNGDVQPSGSPSVRATSSAISPPESSTAPTMSGRAGTRTGDSGMKRQTRIRATSPMTAETTNSQRQFRLSTTRPDDDDAETAPDAERR